LLNISGNLNKAIFRDSFFGNDSLAIPHGLRIDEALRGKGLGSKFVQLCNDILIKRNLKVR
jgi:hypothetical protein